jgi:CheY-like chemotaxis protein
MNLLKNALKFTHTGFVEFGYHKITNREASFIEFYVKDTGIGIPPESRELIFEIFRQGDDSHTRNFGGTGIGLSVAKKLTELLGGKISVESKVNVGSTFYFTIPYTNNNHIPVIAEKTPALAPNYYPGKTILVAEDEDSNYELLEVLIKLTSARVIRAKDGQEAIDLCKTVPEINMVLMDLKMPGTTGYQATIEIKKIRPELPIVAQTAYAMPGDRSKALEAGCDDYLSKPIKKQPLMEKIGKFLGA